MLPRCRLLSLSIAGLLLAGCSTQHVAVSDTGEAPPAESPSPVADMPAPSAPPAPRALAAPAAAAEVAGSAATLDAVLVGRGDAERMRASEAAEAVAKSARIARDKQHQAQAGLLTAGDYDDLLNPQWYARYAERYLQDHAQSALPFVDTRTPVKLRVVGRDGLPVAFAEVAAIGETGRGPRLQTAANGMAVFFPSLDRLSRRMRFDVVADGAPVVRQSVDIEALGGDRTVTVRLPIAGRAPRALDLLLAIDTTGSMTDELEYLQAELDSIVASLRRIRPGTDIRVGLVAYRDQADDYVTRSFAFTGDLARLRADLDAQQADGGGDYPEAVDRAFADAAGFDWRADAAKVLLHVADAPPHDDRTGAAWEQAQTLRTRGVHIVPVAASGVADEAQYLMRSMAALTQGRYLFLTDDSGVGLPHQEPDVPCYVVTRLDGLIERVVASLLTGRRVEPAEDAILRRSGHYERGVCRPTARPRIAQ